MKCFGKLNGEGFTIRDQDGALSVDVPDGAFALVNETNGVLSLQSGQLISVQPNGAVQTRPAGQVGPWEQGVIDGGVITYTPDPASGIAYVFGLKNA